MTVLQYVTFNTELYKNFHFHDSAMQQHPELVLYSWSQAGLSKYAQLIKG